MDWIGWIIGIAGVGYAVWTDLRSRTERRRLHSFLKGLKPGVEAGNVKGVIAAINDEMAMIIPPKISN